VIIFIISNADVLAEEKSRQVESLTVSERFHHHHHHHHLILPIITKQTKHI